MRLHPCLICRLAVLSSLLAVGSWAFAADAPKTSRPGKADKPQSTTAKSAKMPTTHPSPSVPAGVPEVLQKAIDALTAEYEPLLKDQKSAAAGTTRLASDYFKDKKVTVTQDEMLATLNKKLNKDPRIDAYIKWQIISAQSGEFDEAHLKEAARLYQRPMHLPPSRPGSAPREQQELKAHINRLNKDDVAAANDQWKQLVAFHMLQYRPMLSYREELYARLPKMPDVINLAMQDMNSRIDDGYSIKEFLNQVMSDARATAAGMKPNDIRRFGQMLQSYVGRTGPSPFESIVVDEKTKAVSWKSAGVVSFDKKTMDEVLEAMDQMAKSGI